MHLKKDGKMRSTKNMSLGTLRSLRNFIAALLPIAAFAFCVAWQTPSAAIAAVYTYTPGNSDTDLWAAGTNWNAIPVDSPTAELTFVGDNATVLPDGLTNTSTDNISGRLSLNILDLQGTGPASGAATINITISSPNNYLQFISNGSISPVVNLNAMAGAAGLTYNVNSTIMLANNTTFQGDGTANFIFSGIILGNGSLIKNGSSMLTLTGTANCSGGIVVNAGSLQIGDGTAHNGTVVGNMIDNATVVFANPSDQSYDGVIAGTGN